MNFNYEVKKTKEILRKGRSFFSKIKTFYKKWELFYSFLFYTIIAIVFSFCISNCTPFSPVKNKIITVIAIMFVVVMMILKIIDIKIKKYENENKKLFGKQPKEKSLYELLIETFEIRR